jgi:hypothetical protein
MKRKRVLRQAVELLDSQGKTHGKTVGEYLSC